MSVQDWVPDALAKLSKRREIGQGRFISYCIACRCEIKGEASLLLEELTGEGPHCHACFAGGRGLPRRGSPQEAHDMAYHGSRYHAGEW